MHRLGRRAAKQALEERIRENAAALHATLKYCAANGIGAFRINSQILPLKTHPEVGYDIKDLPGGSELIDAFRAAGRAARRWDIRISFHPDQFVVLNSPDPGIVARSVAELVYQAEVAGWVGADVITLHGGGGYGDKPAALKRLEKSIRGLPDPVRRRLALENDDHVYTPAELLPVCRATGVPLCYDVHHHRCLPDGMSVAEVTRAALKTWNREPLFHISSPRHGWHAPGRQRHHDYINPLDFPREWCGLDITVEVEAKAKEKAVRRLCVAGVCAEKGASHN